MNVSAPLRRLELQRAIGKGRDIRERLVSAARTAAEDLAAISEVWTAGEQDRRQAEEAYRLAAGRAFQRGLAPDYSRLGHPGDEHAAQPPECRAPYQQWVAARERMHTLNVR